MSIEVFEDFFLVFCVFLLISLGVIVCFVRKIPVPPQPFWVLTLSLCIIMVAMAAARYKDEYGYFICALGASVSFTIGFLASIRKE